MHCLWLIISAANRLSGLSQIDTLVKTASILNFVARKNSSALSVLLNLESLVSLRVLFPHIMHSLLLLSFDFCCFESLSSSTNTELSASLFSVLFSFRFLFSSSFSVIPFDNSSCNSFERSITFSLPVDVLLKFSLF